MSFTCVHGLSLQHFRSYNQKTFLFPQQVIVVVGENAAGKTSIIEAINLLATGESFRAEEVSEMISFGEEIGRVKAKIIDAEKEETDLEVMLTRGVVQEKKVQSRLYSVNAVRRRKKDFIRHFFTVVFRPEDMRLVEGSPSRRRQFIDVVLTATDPEYAVALKTYEEALKRRNRLLQNIQEGRMPKTVLTFWTNTVVKHGKVLQEKRRSFFEFFHEVAFPLSFTIEYLPSVMSEERMADHIDREIAAGHSLIGPHKDDFQILFSFGNGPTSEMRSVALFGSRGQQRLAVLWLKMSELHYVMEQTQAQPILLLDDILSELDQEHRRQVLSLVGEGQAIITTAEEKMVSEIQESVKNIEVIRI